MPRSSPKLSVGFLFDDTLDSSDGVAQYVKTLGAWLSAQGHDVSYLVGETKIREWAGAPVYSLSKNLRIKWAGNRLSMPLLASKKDIKRVLAGNDFDVLHVMVPYSPLMAQRVINRSSPSTAVIGTFHVFPGHWLARFGSKLLRILYGSSLRRLQSVLAVSPAAARFAKQSFGLNTDPSSNMVELSRFRKAVRKNDKKQQIVFLGRLVERKGCEQLINAFALLHAKMTDVDLVIAGDGPQRAKLEKLVKDRGLQNNVKFLGFIDEKDKPGLLANADIACFPSLYGEAFGIVLIEAMAAGAGVVVGGDNPGYRSVLGSQSKLLVNPRDSRELADRLEELLTDKDLAVRLHVWQTKEVERYDVATVGPELLKVYRRAIANRGSSRHN